MDDIEDDARYPPNPYGGVNNKQGYGSSQQSKLNATAYSTPTNNRYVDDEEDEDGETGEEEDENNHVNGMRMVGKNSYDDDDEEDSEDDDDNNNNIEEHDDGKNFCVKMENVGNVRRPKKRKLESLISNYEFAPRVPTQSNLATSSRPSFGGRNPSSDWTEHETCVLLDAWGERFLQHGRKSLRSDEWQEVSEKVSQQSKNQRTDTQCRNRLDTLKKKYKKEKTKLAESGGTSKWVFFRKMDMLMSSPRQQQVGLSCGVDSGEFVFMNPKVYLNRSNGLDEMRDSPGNSESSKQNDNDSDGLPPKRRRNRGKMIQGCSFELLADSIQKFSEIYEKIETNKQKQMVELEKMRMDFQRELETQRRQILETAQAEIVKIRKGEDEENDASADNVSG